MARIDDTSSVGPEVPQQMLQQGIPSVGIAAARLMVLEPDKERWRQVSSDWYLRGLAFTPGAGKLHHHLGVLSRDSDLGDREELRAVYHFVKRCAALLLSCFCLIVWLGNHACADVVCFYSMVTTHAYPNSRKAVLLVWTRKPGGRRPTRALPRSSSTFTGCFSPRFNWTTSSRSLRALRRSW